MRDPTLPLVLAAVIFAFVAVAGIRRRVLFRLSAKNIARRKTRTVIVVLGLLVGTALISSAMVVGDTLEYIFVEDVLQRWHLTDETVDQKTAGMYLPFDASYFDVLKENLSARGAPIDGIAATIVEQLTVRNEATGNWAGPVYVIGVNSSFESGFGDMVSLDGRTVTTQQLAPGEVVANQRVAEKLSASAGDELRIYFNQSSFSVTVTAILRNEGLANFDKQPVLVMSLEYAQFRLQMPDLINLIRVSNVGGEEDGVRYSQEVAGAITAVMEERGWTTTTNLRVENVKRDGLDDARDISREITQVFFIMGSFAVVAGILLIINIFVMMAEERKGEMGVSRAIGMTKWQLTQTFIFEGTVYVAVSAVLGAIVGLALGYVVIYFFSVVMPIGESGLTVTFHYDVNSVVMAFAIGVLITSFAVVAASWWVSRLNIVRAIRDQPEPIPTRTTKTEAAIAAMLFLGGSGAFLARSYPPANIAWVPLIILGGLMLSLRVVNPRWSFTLGGIGIVAWTLGPKFVERSESDIYVPFVLAGLMLILGGVLLVVFNSSSILNGVIALGARRKGRPVLRTALTYLMSKRFRTGMTLAMFSLIMCAVTS